MPPISGAGPLLSSAQAARLLGVGPSSVKRWADEGVLPCLKTAGRHRRFPREAVERLRDTQAIDYSTEMASLGAVSAGPKAAAPPPSPISVAVAREALAVDDWLRLLTRPTSPQTLDGRLLEDRAALGSWARVAESFGPVLDELGRRWSRGRLSVLDEHLASERLQRALGRACDLLPLAGNAPRALLATAEGDEHTLGLSLVELCLRERGFRALWAGRVTPAVEVHRAVDEWGAELVAISASSASRNARRLRGMATRLARACRRRGAALILGGTGAWPRSPSYARRFVELAAFNRWLAAR